MGPGFVGPWVPAFAGMTGGLWLNILGVGGGNGGIFAGTLWGAVTMLGIGLFDAGFLGPRPRSGSRAGSSRG